ncbi:MAG: hypothetical protein FK734_11355 [Asgard group archaeon]|nr:hypothetical protein [Asgard group archaeon]
MFFQRIINTIKRSKKGLSGVIIILIIIFAIIVLGIALIFILRGGAISEIGQIEYTYDSSTNNEFTLNIYNAVGKIDIQYNDTQTELMKATLVVYGRSNADLADALNFTKNDFTDEIIISFDSGISTLTFFNKKAFYQDLFITLNPNASIIYHIETNVGSIDFNSDSIVTSIIRQFEVRTQVGNINIDFGQNTYLTTNYVKLITSLGNITLISQEVHLATEVTFEITGTIGHIYLLIAYNDAPDGNYTIEYIVQSSTGDIDLLYTFSPEIGVVINATTTTGTINIPGGGTSYQSPDIGSKTAIYDFDFQTTTGDITAALT